MLLQEFILNAPVYETHHAHTKEDHSQTCIESKTYIAYKHKEYTNE